MSPQLPSTRNGPGDSVSSGNNNSNKTYFLYTTPPWLNDKEQQNARDVLQQQQLPSVPPQPPSSSSPEDPIISPVGSGSSSSSNPNLVSDVSNSIVTSHLLLVAISSLVSVIFAFLTLPLLIKPTRYVSHFTVRLSHSSLLPQMLFFFLLLLLSPLHLLLLLLTLSSPLLHLAYLIFASHAVTYVHLRHLSLSHPPAFSLIFSFSCLFRVRHILV